MDAQPTPYGEYPTDTRFRRPEYKFFKTLADGEEFASCLPSGPSLRISSSQRHLHRRPATAAPTAGRREQQQQQQQHRQHKYKEPEPGWRPQYPEPDLASLRPASAVTDTRRPCSPAASTASTSIPAFDEEFLTDTQERQKQQLQQQQQQQQQQEQEASEASVPQRPDAPVPPLQAAQQQIHVQLLQQRQHKQQQQQLRATTLRPATAAATVSGSPALAVAMDFGDSLQPGTGSPQPKATVSDLCLRPKTAPAKFIARCSSSQIRQQSAAAAADSCRLHGSLLVQGTRMHLQQQQDRHHQNLEQQQQQQQQQQQASSVHQLSEAYDKALNEHGWRMELPGDPLGLKRPLLPERKAVNLSVPEPTAKPLAPRMRRSNRFTFFHTTMPRVVMSFDIHPTFTSEQYGKARAELRKQGKWNFGHRDFSFIY